MRKLLPLAALLATACAAHPAFRKGGEGYTIKETPIPEILFLQMQFPASTPEDYRLDYLTRAAGEECAARKYSYFDMGASKNGAKIFCYAKDTMAHLSATFAMKAQGNQPPELRVEETQRGRATPLSPWDVVRKLDGRSVRDVADIKETLFLAGRKGLRRVSVLVERSDIPLTFEAPVYDDSSALNTPEKLESLREKIP